MKVSLYAPDSKYHNLAMMKLSTYYKQQGAEIFWNFPLAPADLKYCSILFNYTSSPLDGWLLGGPGIDFNAKLYWEVENCKPDYSLYPKLDYSVGYTYRYCPMNCPFCVVPYMEHDKKHFSIWTFHDPKFKKIALLNNNTFSDSKWYETFDEIEEAGLIYVDNNGFDIRLATEEKIFRLSKLRVQGEIHFAWDRMEDEDKIMKGINLLKKYFPKHKLEHHIVFYILVGYNTTVEQDFYRVQTIARLGFLPFIMRFVKYEDKKMNLFTRRVNQKVFIKSIDWNRPMEKILAELR